MANIILGSVLNSFMDSVNGVIQNAINRAETAGENLLIEAGRQVGIAIQNAENAYVNSMNKTMDKVDETVIKGINQITSMVQDLQDRNEKALKEMGDRAQLLIDSLPWHDKQPKLMQVMPRYTVISTITKEIFFQFNGNFEFAGTKGFEPTLVFGDQKFQLAKSETKSLGFEVINSVFEGSMERRSYVVGSLQIPWDDAPWYWPWSNKRVDTYKVWLGALPLSPGKITVEYKKAHEERRSQPHVSKSLHAEGHYPNDWTDRHFTEMTTLGWQVVPSSSKFVVEKEPGRDTPHGNWDKKISEGIDRIDCTVACGGWDGKHMGIVDFHLEYTEFQNVTVFSKRQVEITLKWGDSRILESDVEGEQFSKLTFVSFDDRIIDFAGPDTSKPYIKLRDQGGKMVVSAEVPDEVVNARRVAALAIKA